LVRFSSNKTRLLLLSSNDELVDKFLMQSHWKNHVKAAQIMIPDLVRQLTEKPDVYSLGIVYARVDGYGRSLRAISLYGADLAEAQLFRDILPKLVPFRTLLRDVRTGNDILQIGSKGEVGFNYRNPKSLSAVDKALFFLTEKGLLLWDREEG
jgi:hypothetical protein